MATAGNTNGRKKRIQNFGRKMYQIRPFEDLTQCRLLNAIMNLQITY